MLKNYLKITFRNIFRHKTFSFINIFGLSVGLACAIFIFLWVNDEMSYDKYHKNSENIYLVLRGDNSGMTAVTSKFLAPALKQDLSAVVNSTSYEQLPSSIKVLIQTNTKGFEENFGLADSNFFKVFSFSFLEGDASTALSVPNSVVITKKMAEKYFGKESALGKILTVTLFGVKRSMGINGVIENIPLNSHLQSQIIFHADLFQTFGNKENGWNDQSFETYVQLSNELGNKIAIDELSAQIKQCEMRHHQIKDETVSYSLLPIEDIHLYGSSIKFLNETGDVKYVRIFTAVALFILLIACVNYMNISTALSIKRSKEIGIKKTVGAERKLLILQFMGEGLIYSLIALVFAILFIKLLLPGFNDLSGKNITINFFDPYFIFGAMLLAVITGLISGLYPAILLSSFQPIQILTGKLRLGSTGLSKKGLIIFQFSISITMIISTFIVFDQLNFIRKGNLGLDKENLLCISLTGDSHKNYEVLKNELLKNPDIIGISRSEEVNSSTLSATGFVFKNDNQKYEECNSWVLYTDYGFASTYKIEMKEGRFFSESFSTDGTNAFVINETAAKSMRMKSPLNEMIYLRGRLGKIIGVTKDFHFASFHNSIEPLVFMIPDSNQQAGRFRIVTVKFKSAQPDKIISFIENIWEEKLSGVPFNYHFYDDSLNSLHQSDIRMGTLFTYFSFISILIACIGLFGLASISTEQSTKEIGIRKVLGASISNVAFILTKDFLILVLLSNVIAFPVAYYFMNKWLQDFAYRIEISWWMFVLSGGIALLIALVTVSFQAVKAATTNPVESLKYE